MNHHLRISHIHLVGGGGHALVVAEAARASGHRVIGFYDDADDCPMASCLGRLGTFDSFMRRVGNKTPTIIAVGALQLRRFLLERHTGEFASVLHPTAIIAQQSQVGRGTFIAAGAIICVNADVGPHNIINTRAVVEHDCRLATNVHIGPGAVLGGGVNVGSHTLVGLNATIKSNVSIGSDCIVGAGAVVVNDVADGEVVAGIPARPMQRGAIRRAIA